MPLVSWNRPSGLALRYCGTHADLRSGDKSVSQQSPAATLVRSMVPQQYHWPHPDWCRRSFPLSDGVRIAKMCPTSTRSSYDCHCYPYALMLLTRSLFLMTMMHPHPRLLLRIMLHGGDNMLGRAVQLTLAVQAPGEERLRDSCTAEYYLDMCLHPSAHPQLTLKEMRARNAEKGSYLWGDRYTMDPPPDVRLVNLETAVTRTIDNHDIPRYKGINYHMHLDNLEPVLDGLREQTYGGDSMAPLIVNCANNHAMDYGRKALEQETLPLLDRLQSATLQFVGLGRDFAGAAQPAVVECASTKVQVFGFSAACAGTPGDWWATSKRSGLVGLPGLYSHSDADRAFDLAQQAMDNHPKTGLRIVSIHWGPNWAGKGEDAAQVAARRRFAHRLIDEAKVDLVYGHSSHHARGLEVYHGHLIVYGAGDIINDYEGFENPGEERYNRLGGVYLVDVHADTGQFAQLSIVPTYMDRLSLRRWTPSAALWRPQQRRLERNAAQLDDWCRFLQNQSRTDAGSDGALVLHVVDDDPHFPGGPILRSR